MPDELEEEVVAVSAAHGGLVVGFFFFFAIVAALPNFLWAQIRLGAAGAFRFALRAHVLSFVLCFGLSSDSQKKDTDLKKSRQRIRGRCSRVNNGKAGFP